MLVMFIVNEMINLWIVLLPLC